MRPACDGGFTDNMERISRRVFLGRAAGAAAVAAGLASVESPPARAQARNRVIRSAFVFSPGTFWAFNESLWSEFARELGVEVESRPGGSIAAIRSAFARGDVDLVVVDPIETLNLRLSGGGKPRVIATAQPRNEFLFVVNGERVPTIRHLNGARLAISAPGATPVVILQVALARRGVDLAASGALLVGVGGGPLRAQALLSDRVDGTVLNRDDTHEALAANPKFKVLIDCAEAVPLVFTSLQGGEAFLDDPANRETIVRALEARARMLKWIYDNKWKYLERYVRAHPTANVRILGPAHDALVRIGQFDPDLTTDLSSYTATMDVYAKEANPPLAKGTIPAREWIDTSFRDQAIRRLGGRGWWRK
jgi:ABC-type nitrate/sulfonate/bicarbonate transport system substrate-binding protein